VANYSQTNQNKLSDQNWSRNSLTLAGLFYISKLCNWIVVSNKIFLSHKLTAEVLTPQKSAYAWFCSFLIAKFI
jgi:hypothetical protein